MGWRPQLLGGELPETVLQILLAPIAQDVVEFLAVDTEAVGYVIQARPGWSISMVVDLHRYRTPLTIGRLNLDPEKDSVPDLPAGIAG
jgi:hypothetical protein